MKKRKGFSLTTRYVVIVGLLLFTANIVLGVVMLSQSKNAMKTMIRKNMLDISNTAAGLLDGDVMAALTEEDVGTPVFREIADKLIVFQNNADIEFIYAAKQDGDRYVFTVDPDPVDPGEFGEELVVTRALVEAAKGVATVDDSPQADRWGNFYSAYSPIFDSAGEVAGVVGVDFSAAWYEEQLRQHTMSISVISILSVLFGAAVMLLITDKVRKKFFEIDSELSNIAGSVDELTREIVSSIGYRESLDTTYAPVKADGVVSSDEMEALSAKIHATQQELECYLRYVHAQAYTDSLTRIGNTNAYQEELLRLDEQIRSGAASFCAVVLDIDNLKTVNDRFGHACGDRVIRGAAQIIADVFGAERTFRIGGDEFLAIPLNMSEEEANAEWEKLRDGMDAFNSAPDHPAAKLAMSMGAAAYRPGVDSCFQEVFVRADEVMYENKSRHHSKEEARIV